MQPMRFGPIRFSERGDCIQNLDVAQDQRRDVRPQDLDDDGLPFAQPRGVDLRDRRRGERTTVELGENLLDGPAEGHCERGGRLVAGERRHLVLELRELGGDIGRQQIGTHRERLAELDEDRPELLEREAQPHAERPACSAERQ
jgi:hypothetical protein